MFKRRLSAWLSLLMAFAHWVGTDAFSQLRPSAPEIASVTPIASQQTQTITITGRGFGRYPAYTNRDIPYLAIRDKTAGWAAGRVTRQNIDAVTLNVARWTDTEIVVTGFAGAYGGGWQLRDGDQVEVAVWNAQTGAGAATFELTVGGSPQRLTPPTIKLLQPQVSGLTASINGVTLPTTQGATVASIAWSFGDGTPSINSWFPCQHKFPHAGSFLVTVVAKDTNGLTAATTVTLTVEASPADTTGAPVIMSVSPIGLRAFQTIVIHGSGFGTQPPYDGDSPFIMVSDLTRNWRAGCRSRPECGPGDNRVTLRVSNWSDTEVRLDGFTGTYARMGPNFFNLGDRAEVWVWNAQNGAGPATYEMTVGRGAGAADSGTPSGSAPPRVGMTPKTGIHSVDFLNFDYPSDCSQQFDGFGKVIHVSNGQWTKEDIGGFAVGKTASKWMVGYGDLRGDGQDEALVVTSCQGLANFDYEEIFVFADSSAGPQLLAKLSPSEWGPGTRIHDVHAEKQQLVVGFLEGGSHACPDTLVTARFRWSGTRFLRTGADSKPFKCQ